MGICIIHLQIKTYKPKKPHTLPDSKKCGADQNNPVRAIYALIL